MDNIIINMAKLEFPNVVGWTQQYFTGGDNLPTDIKLTSGYGMYAHSNNTVIDVNFDTSNLIDTQYMFDSCQYMIALSLFDTSNVTNMSYMFQGCSNLETVPLFDTSNVTNISYMFNSCYLLKYIPQYNFENVTNATNLFQNCSYLLTLPALNLKKVTSLNSIFPGCNKLTSIGIIDCDSVTSVSNCFGYFANTSIKNVGGFRNLGAKSSLSGTTSGFIDNIPNLTRQSLLNIFNELYDRASAGYSVVTLKLHANHHAILTDEDKAIATNKGWALS